MNVRNLQTCMIFSNTEPTQFSSWPDVSRDCHYNRVNTDLWLEIRRRNGCGHCRCVHSRHICIDQHRREPASQTALSDCAHRNVCIRGPTTQSQRVLYVFQTFNILKLTNNIRWTVRKKCNFIETIARNYVYVLLNISNQSFSVGPCIIFMMYLKVYLWHKDNGRKL